VAVAAAYYEDKLGAPPTQVHFAGHTFGADPHAEGFAAWIGEPGLDIIPLGKRPETGAATSLGSTSIAGVAGALAGVR
jgi:hypothetical protein